MINVEDEYMKVDPEMERIWREDEDPSFTEIRAAIPADEESEQPEASAEPEDSDEEDPETESEDEESEGADESQPDEEEESEPKVEEVKSTSYKVKANQMEFDLSVDELVKLAPKALDYTKKMQEIAPWRKSISALKESGMGEQDVNLMIDVLKGDKAAIAEVLKRTQVDPLDLDTDAKEAYVPNQYGTDEATARIEEIVSQIRREPEYMITEQVIDETWDSKSRTIIAKNPDMITGLHLDVKSGVYQQIAPMALKMKALDGGRLADVEYYIEAGREFYAKQAPVEAEVVKQVVAQKQVEERQADIKEMSSKRKAASPTKRMSGKRDVIDYLSDDDESYEEWYKQKIASV